MSAGRERVVVVGGGAIGLAVAWEMARRGRDVLLLERERPGAGSTWAAGGMLAPVSEAELEPEALIEFGRESARLYPELVSRLESESGMDCGYRTEGTLWVAVSRDDAEELAHLEATLGERGLPVERLDAACVREREPHLSGRVLGGLSLAHDYQIDPRRLVRALERAILGHGGRIVSGARVTGV
jgi:glycine oxidase